MGIIGNNIFCISSYSTIYELVIVNILAYQAKMKINLLIDSRV